MSAERKAHLLSVISPLYKAEHEILDDLRAIPAYEPNGPDELGTSGRADLAEFETRDGMLQSILREGELLAGHDVIDVDEQREIIVVNTIAKSPHTVFCAPYASFDRYFRQEAEQAGIKLQDGPLLTGRDSTPEMLVPPTSVPLDMLVWIMSRNKHTSELTPVDLADFRSIKTGNPLIDQYRMELSDEKMVDVFMKVAKRGKLARNTLLQVYEKVICNEIPELPKKLPEDILAGATNGYHRKDDIKDFEQMEYDGTGGGPMSNQTTHFRFTCHLSMETLNELDIQNNEISFDEMLDILASHKFVFGKAIHFMPLMPRPFARESQAEVYRKLFIEKGFTPEDFLKMLDPYSTLLHELLEPWMESRIAEGFQSIEGVQVATFAHHEGHFKREMRVTEGAEVIYPAITDEEQRKKALAEGLVVVTDFISKTLYPLWSDVKSFIETRTIMTPDEKKEELARIQKRYGLPEKAIQSIAQLRPTLQQLQNLRYQTSNELDVQEGSGEENKQYQEVLQAHINRIDHKIGSYHRKRGELEERKKLLLEDIASGNATYDDFLELIYIEQIGQLYQDTKNKDSLITNKGYNIPGVPGNAVTYHVDDDSRLHISLGWLLSKKGLFELWTGAILKKIERK